MALGALAALVTLAAAASAEFDAGLEAFDRGDYPAAYREWLGPAKAGDASAQTNLGVLYWRGQGIDEDHVRAAEWFRRAAEQGNPIAQDSLGQMYYLGQGVEQDDAQAALWIGRAAEQGDPSAQLRLGSLYAEGIGVERDPAAAVTWWRRSADQGNAEAGIRLGLAYERGLGVPADPQQAQLWFDRAAEARADGTPGVVRGTPAALPPAAPDPAPGGSGAPAAGLATPSAAQGTALPSATVQLAAVGSPDAALAAWERLRKANPDLLGSLHLEVQRVDLGGGGTYYRVRAGPLVDRDAAHALCEKLESRALECLVSPEP